MSVTDQLPLHWQLSDNSLVRVFVFASFVDCVRFITEITPLAEAMQHHPDISVFKYKHVKITLTTHDAGTTVTSKDIMLAEKINDLYDKFGQV